MMDSLVIVLAMVIVVLAWNRMSKGMDWVGERIGETGDMLSDITTSGAKQTSRGVVISHDSLMDTISESVEKDANRRKKATKFKKGLNEEEIKALKTHEDYLDKILKRA